VVKERLTIAEASQLTGLTKRALARRVERGQLAATLDNGLRYIEATELARAGLLNLQTGEPPSWAGRDVEPETVARELIETLIRQNLEIYELRQRLDALVAESRSGDATLREQIEQARRERRELRRDLELAQRERAELRERIEGPRHRRRAGTSP
jgi:chromosome segregation ATPase